MMFVNGVNATELGGIAIEIILKRNDARNELERNPTFDKKWKSNVELMPYMNLNVP